MFSLVQHPADYILLGLVLGMVVGWTLRVMYLYHAKWSRAYPGKHRSASSLPSPPLEVSHARAAERRRAIGVTLERPNLSLGQEFLETPPGFEPLRRDFLENPLQRAAQMTRLLWQLQSDELLLAERVVDAVIAVPRGVKPGGIPSVHLVPERSVGTRKDRFPWKVVLESESADEYRNQLSAIAGWLGIGIDFSPAREVRPLGHCSEPFGRSGVLGGFLYDGNTYGMTCSHVLAPTCGSVVIRAEASLPDTPDAALIRLGSPCFAGVEVDRACSPASEEQIREWATKRSDVVKRTPLTRTKKGFICSRTLAFPMNGDYYRFPHCAVSPKLAKFLLYVPFGRRPFSKEGDSGSWVFEQRTGSWVGMLICGDSDFLVSYVAEAQPLLDYFERGLQEERRGGSFKTAVGTVSPPLLVPGRISALTARARE